jgi:GNAT superfamily N-acetyltransferase
MQFHVDWVVGFPEQQLDQLLQLINIVDGVDLPVGVFASELRPKEIILCCFAWSGKQLVGYKIGYEQRPGYFESWIGGVLPEYRRKGIATALLNAQHQWCKEAGYRFIDTQTAGDNHAMLIANLKAGFEICGTYWDRKQVMKVILQKRLVGG